MCVSVSIELPILSIQYIRQRKYLIFLVIITYLQNTIGFPEIQDH